MDNWFRFPNGLEIRGSHEAIVYAARKLGFGAMFDGEYYNSSTKGLIRIDEMDTTHLRNAILKMHKDWVDGLREIVDPEKLIFCLKNDCQDLSYKAMVREYSTRDPE
jgi:hypothetical protein